MNENDPRMQEALFRLSVLGDLIHCKLQRGELKARLREKAARVWEGPNGKDWHVSAKTIEKWFYDHRAHGLEGLVRKTRSDKGSCKALTPELQELILDMKREDPGRSVPVILRELVDAGKIRQDEVSESTVQRLLKRQGLSGPKLELDRPARYRWQASRCGELWQVDCCHGPKLYDPASGREVRVKIFGLIDDRSRLLVHAWATFEESQEEFLVVLLAAIRRRGRPLAVLADNHGSFTGGAIRLACARLDVRLLFAKPHDGPAKGKIERFWRTMRAHVLDRLDMTRIETLDDINLRLSTWTEGDYNQQPHSAHGGRSPLEVWEEDAGEIRWIDDDALLEEAAITEVERHARNDATCQIKGRTYEVPPHLRRRKVRIRYSLLRPELMWIEDGGTQCFLREVDPVENSRRSRVPARPEPKAPLAKPTGLHPVEDLLGRQLRPFDRNADEEGGAVCAGS